MAQPARLITPQGETIELTAEAYREIEALLGLHRRDRSAGEITEVISATFGKYAGGLSLTAALLQERTEDRAREDARAGRFHDK